MASSRHFLLPIFSLFSISHAYISYTSTDAIIFPVTKHSSSHHYLTKVHLGTQPVPVNLIVDLGSPFIWADCAFTAYVSSSRRFIPCRSIQCSTAKAHDCGTGSGPGPTINTCGSTVENPITREITRGELTEDSISAVQYEGSSKSNSVYTVQFLYYCTNPIFSRGLPSGVNGILGLGRTRTSVPSQLAMGLGLARKFTICLSPTGGQITIGETLSGTGTSKSLTYTPLNTIKGENTLEAYFINVTSIKINSERIPIDTKFPGTKISTIVPYTIMESTVYEAFIKVYTKVVTVMNMTRVESVAPFRVCYDSKDIGATGNFGLTVPDVDLVMQSEMVKWRINRGNLMVQVSSEVVCLGFLDGGSDLKASIVIGVHQLENNFLEFDLSSSILGFSSSLQDKHTTCSNLRFHSSQNIL